MKKTFILGLTAFMCFGYGMQAQQKSMVNLSKEVSAKQLNKGTFNPSNVHSNKKTRGGSRWYNEAEAQGLQTGINLFDQDHMGLNYMWQDSTILGNFGGTLDNVWIKSIAQVLDPRAPMFNDPTNFSGEIAIGSGSQFSIDSVGMTFAYVRNPANAGVVDTLIVTVSRGNGAPSDLGFFPETQSVVVTPYGVDTIYIADPLFDFATLTLKKNAGSLAYTKKIPLDQAVANDTTANGWNYIAMPVTGLTNLTPNSFPVMTVTFKSGSTWMPNVDSISMNGAGKNYMLFASSRENPPAGFRNYIKGDYNMSHILKNDTTGWGEGYIPSFYFNSPGYEFHWFDYKLTCATCAPVAVNDITLFNDIKVYPNPASSELSVVVNLKENAENVTLDITNTLGQIVKTQTIGKVVANQNKGEIINISNLSKGMYIYTLHANGQKVSNKLIVE